MSEIISIGVGTDVVLTAQLVDAQCNAIDLNQVTELRAVIYNGDMQISLHDYTVVNDTSVSFNLRSGTELIAGDQTPICIALRYKNDGLIHSTSIIEIIHRGWIGEDLTPMTPQRSVMSAGITAQFSIIVPPAAYYAGASPKIGANGNWYVFNDDTKEYDDSGVSANHSNLQIIAAEEERRRKENERLLAETERLAAEATRKNNENARIAAETDRKSSETTRKSAETERIAAEADRKSSETTRKSAETFRVFGENDRVASETTRKNNENARIASENERLAAEALRIEAELDRNNRLDIVEGVLDDATSKMISEMPVLPYGGELKASVTLLNESAPGVGVIVLYNGLFVCRYNDEYYTRWSNDVAYGEIVANGVKPSADKIYKQEERLFVFKSDSLTQISGSGGGFYNVSVMHPLESGFYDKETAIIAVSSADIQDENKIGLIITFETSKGVWEEYRFLGAVADFGDTSYWEEFGAKGAVKNIMVVKGVQQTELTPDKSGKLVLELQDITVDETIDKGSSNPVMNSAVASEFERQSGKYGASLKLNEIGEGAEKAYSLSLMSENGEVISTSDMFTGGGGGSVATTRIELTRVSSNPTVKFGDEVKLAFSYDHKDTTTGDSTGESGYAVITITRGASVNTIERVLTAPSLNYMVDVTPYIGVGNNTVRVRVSVGEGETQQVSSITWAVNVVQLTLNSSFNIATEIRRGDTVYIPFALTGAGTKTLRCYVDGVAFDDKTIVTSTANGSFAVNTALMTHGSHSIQMVCELELAGGTVIKSNSVYFDIAVRESGKLSAIVATRFDFKDGAIIAKGDRPYLTARQYEGYSLTYAVYDPTQTPSRVEVLENNVVVSSANVSYTTTVLALRAMGYGDVQCKIICGDVEYGYSLNVSKSELSLTEPTDNIQLKLSATGRTNSDVNKDSWEYGSIKTVFSGVQWGADGWINNALRLTNNGRAVVQYAPLAQPTTNANNSFAISIKYRVTEVINDDAVVISCVDSSGVGFEITTQEARMKTRGGSTLAMQMAAGQVYEVGFVSYPVSTEQSSDNEKINTEMVLLYINGKMSGCVQRGASDSIYQNTPAYISFGSNYATTEIFILRSYSSYLSDAQMLDLYILDQDNVDLLLDKYERNDILDDTGIISVDSVPDSMPYMILTGKQANGVATALQAAINNNKDTRYELDRVLFINKANPSMNFVMTKNTSLTGYSPVLRLQGTSSLAYPIKNYRIYTHNKGKYGLLYVGCDNQGLGGTLVSDGKYSFKIENAQGKLPAPVDCWCLKADFAESSSSHNTGMARIVNDTLVGIGELTPVQKGASADFAYDVRTTIDGFPILVFYQETIDATPVLIGKYNFNNDKSTEAVFGFKNIPGYHDASWVTDTFAGVNPTECWEFLTNDLPMGSFLDDDFVSKYTDEQTGAQICNWTKMFEARFPDDDAANAAYENGTKDPKYLRTIVSWVKSTLGNPTKFRNELSNYFDVNYLCDYFVFTEIFGCVDQRVKNMMMGIWYNPGATSHATMGKMRAYMIFYDCDTIMGVRNDGRLKYHWTVNENTVDPELTASSGSTVYAYAGHNSVLWNNLRDAFANEISQAYVRIRAKLTNDAIFNMFDKEQSGKFCERVYNMDALYKYVRPKTQGIDVVVDGNLTQLKYSYLEAMQGDRAAHRRWWITNRMHLYDAKYATGQYTATDIAWKGISKAGAVVKATPSRDFYFQVKSDSAYTHSAVYKDIEWSYTYNQDANVGTIFHLYGGIFMKALNLSGWGGFTDFTLPTLPILETLIMGSSTKTYTLSEFVVSTKLPMLRALNMQNYTMLPELDLSYCNRLENVVATGCTALSTIKFAQGAPLTSISLPVNFQTLVLRSLPFLTRAGIVLANKANLTGLWIDNCANINGLTLLSELLATSGNKLKNVRITGVNITGNGSDLKTWYDLNLSGIDASGNQVATCKLVGDYYLTSYLDDTTYAKYASRFDELNIHQPEYTMIMFDDSIADERNITNLDNGTGCQFATTYKPSAHILRILSGRYRCLGKQVENGKMTIYPLHNENSYYYADSPVIASASPAKLTGEEGDVFMYEPAYWYKGINDYKNNKKYACFSSNINKPTEPTGYKLITLQEIESAIGRKTGYKLLVNKATIAESLTADANYSVLTVSVSGYKKVRFPFVLGTGMIGASFSNDSGTVISSSFVSSLNAKFVDGMYYIDDVPANATKLHFTIHNFAEFDHVILSNASKIEDLEPFWVYKTACLTGVFEITLDQSSRMRSIAGNSTAIASLTQPDFLFYAQQRNLQLIDYEMHKDIANLFFAGYGRRDSQGQCGYGQNTNARIVGNMAVLGMSDTVNPDNKTEYAWVKKVNPDGSITYTQTPSTNCLGYENLFGNMAEWMSGVGVPNSNSQESYKWLIDTYDSTKRKVKSGTTSGYLTGVAHGRHMDIIGVANNTGSSTTYYCDEFYPSGSANRVVFRSSSYAYPNGGVSCANANNGSSNTHAGIGSRLAFRGYIDKAESVDFYKSITLFK